MKLRKYRVIQYVPAVWYYPQKWTWYCPFWRAIDKTGYPSMPQAIACCRINASVKPERGDYKVVYTFTDI